MTPQQTTYSTLPGRSTDHWLRQLAVWLVALPVLCFVAFVFTYAINVPWLDDIDSYLGFMLAYLDAPTLAEKIHTIFVPNNEHRIVTAKLITLALYYLTGEVNFRWLILVALLFLLGIFGLFFRVFQSMRLPLLAFVPVGFVLFQPQYYLTSVSAITSLQHHVVILFTFTAAYLLAGNTQNRFVAALVLQVMGSLSMSNGLFGWVAGAAILALQQQWLRLAGWLGLGIGTILFYFHDFPDGQGNESSLPYFLANPHIVFLAFFTFIGGLFDFFSKAGIVWRSVLPTLAGFILLPMVIYLLWQMNSPLLGRRIGQYASSNPATNLRVKRRYFFTGCYVFLGINALIIAFLRPRFGYEVMLVSNYMQYAALLVVILYLNILSEQAPYSAGTNRATTQWTYVGLLVGGLVWVNWYVVGLPTVASRKHRILTDTFNQKHYKTGLGPSWGTPFLDLADRELTQSTSRGIYHYPDAYYTPLESALLTSKAIRVDSSLQMQVSGGGYSYLVRTENELPNPVGPSAVVIQSQQRTYLFPSDYPFRIANFYLNRPVKAVQGEVLNPTVAPGQYRVGILVPSEAKAPIRFSRQTLTIPE